MSISNSRVYVASDFRGIVKQAGFKNWWDRNKGWADTTLSFMPGIGTAYNAGKAIYALADGRYRDAAINAAWAIPGALGAVGGALGRFGAAGGKLANIGSKMQAVGGGKIANLLPWGTMAIKDSGTVLNERRQAAQDGLVQAMGAYRNVKQHA
jgi:hypothetical protein